jgi:tetratricopeptide (TPR) repeat protein
MTIAQNQNGSAVVESLNQEAIELFNSGKPREAIAKIEQALKIANTERDVIGQVISLNNFGLIYAGLGEYQKAIKFYQQSLPLTRSIRSRTDEAIALNGLGDVYIKQAKYLEANKYFEQALTIVREIGERTGEASILQNIGNSYSSLANYPKAIEYHQKSLKIAREIGSRSLVGVNLNSLGTNYFQQGKYQGAIDYFQQSLSLRRELGHRSGESVTLNNLGAVYDSLGQYQKAIEHYQQSLTIKVEIGDRAGEALSLGNIGVSYDRLDRHQQSIGYFQKALKIQSEIGDRAGEGTTLTNLGSAHQRLSKYPQAVGYFQKALKIQTAIGDRAKEAITLHSLGSLSEETIQYQAALKYYQQSLKIKKEIGDREGEAISLNNKGSVFYQLKQLPQAETELKQAVTIWESLRAGLVDSNKIAFSDRISTTYKLLQKVLVERGKTQEALEISERARARALAELLASKVNSINSTSQGKIRQAPNLTKIQQIAQQKNTTLVQYSLIDDRVYIWVVRPTGKISFKQTQLPPNTKIKDLVVATRDSLGANRGRNRTKDDRKSTIKSDLKQLHQLLIAPIAQDLPQDPNASVTILPQDELLIVPFAALQNSQGKYLIEQHTINIAPSIQVLGLTNTNSRNSGTPLVIGNPIMPPFQGEALSNLPGSEQEAQAIGQIIKVPPLIGAAADKKEVVKRMQRANLIHLATHGFFVRVEGELPGAVALTNGYLTSDEIFDMELQADLVVLSACDTGRGNITGDGVVGLSRSLVVAGVPSVMVSLWEVDDGATKVLMEEFYRQLWIQKLPKAQAMRQAMLKTKQQFDDPNLWAAFMLVGEAK